MRTLALLLIFWSLLAGAPSAQTAPPPVVLLSQSGALGPAHADYLRRGLDKAAALHAQLVVIQMDTPGGLDVSMRMVIKSILASSVPVASFVAPNGARAASAGTYILYASHIAAMAPATHLGAATPVSLLPQSAPPREPAASRGISGTGNAPSSAQAMLNKQTNDAAAYIRGLAELRGRNAEWADKAVREAVSLPAREALKLNVIDVVADDIAQLLRQLDGRRLTVLGQPKQLATAAAEIIEIGPDWRTRLLAVITDPGVAYLLLMIGFYGLLFEFFSPGLVAPGVIGGISLLLALFALQLLPVNYAGLGLIALGMGLLVAEYFAPGFGLLGLGGITAFVIGSVMLIDTDAPAYRLPWPLIASVTVASIAFLLAVLNFALRARQRPVVSGREQLLGALGEVRFNPDGSVSAGVLGEVWAVRSKAPLRPGQKVRVIGIDGLVLNVEPVSPQGNSS
ncbi:nodulation protein NfeD [soil metagenome]